MEKALMDGAIEPVGATTENFMYLRSIKDIDGYIWGILFLDEAKFKQLNQKL